MRHASSGWLCWRWPPARRRPPPWPPPAPPPPPLRAPTPAPPGRGAAAAPGRHPHGARAAGPHGTIASQAFLYSNGTITFLPQPSFTGGLGCQADAINSTGQAAGVCWPSTDTAELVRWHNGTVTDLGTLGTPGTVTFPEAMSINSTGQIVTWIQTSTGAPDGVFYRTGTLTHLGVFPATAINDNGVITREPSLARGRTPPHLSNLAPPPAPYPLPRTPRIHHTPP